MRIEVIVQRPEALEERHHFTKFPVRIGRSGRNDLALHEQYVSETHAVLGWENGHARFTDLGSANGTYLHGKRLTKNEPVDVGAGLTVTIGILTLCMRPLLEAEDGQVRPNPAPEHAQAQPATSTIYGYELASPETRGPQTSPESPGRPSSRRETAPTLEPSHRPPNASAPAPPPPTLTAAVIGEAASAASATSGAVERPGSEGAPRPDTPRAVAVLQAFCESLVAFREGFEEAGRDLGVRPFAQRGPIHSANDAAELMRYLLDENGDPEVRLRDIKSIFGDFARHHVSMMSALDEGMRAVLARVDPRSFDVEKGSRFLPILDKGNWQRLVTAFQSLEGNDRELHEVLFGAEFAEAYAAHASQPDPTPSSAAGSKVGRKSRV